ncbi:MAG: hypothetical protein ABH873_04185 [Candidatus Firestonebacteria bacterium]
MKKENEKKRTFLTENIFVLWTMASRYFETIENLYKENKPERDLYAFCLLATTSLELFLKVIIAADFVETTDIDTEEDIEAMTIKKLKFFGHSISRLIEENGIKDYFGIKEIKEVNNGTLHDYRLIFNEEKVCCFKDSESVRFGLIARKKDMALFVHIHYTDEIIDFLKKAKDISYKKLNEKINSLQGSNKVKSRI